MRKRAAEYQTRVTDQSANSYKVKNTKFDGYKNGKLIEAKEDYIIVKTYKFTPA